MRRLILLLLLLSCRFSVALAADVAVDLSVSSVDQHVSIVLSNRSLQSVALKNLQFELNQRIYVLFESANLPAEQQRRYTLDVELPTMPGSYLIHSRVGYQNGQHWLTLKNVGTFFVGQRLASAAQCQLHADRFHAQQRRFKLHADPSLAWRLFLPDELMVEKQQQTAGQIHYWLNLPHWQLINRYTIYAGNEQIIDGKHYAALCQAAIVVDGLFKSYSRGQTADYWLYTSLLLSLILFLALKKLNYPPASPYIRYLSRLGLISFCYLLLRHAPAILEQTAYTLPDSLVNLADSLHLFSQNFLGSNYRFFFEYFVDVYFWVYVLLALPYFIYYKNVHAHPDKYEALLLSLFSLYRLFLLKRPQWGAMSRLGLLTVCLKLFFLPYLASWAIQNILHLKELLHHPLTGFHAINDLVQTIFTLMDTGLFALGYMIESRRLGSEIKSVDSSFLGWLVCLWCYPPFNTFSFRPFDYPLFNIHIPISPTAQMVVMSVVTALWGIFALSSINLGFKASNLTHRGIIGHGLYRYVRHPAYSSKLLIWYLQGVFLGQYTLGILLAFTVIYVMRGLTEEWHLSQDADYVDYQQRVRWRFIPGIV